MKRANKRRSLTLLEVIVALSLTGLLLSFLWQVYFNSQRQLIQCQIEKESCLKKMLIYQKIGYILDHIDTEKAAPLLTLPVKNMAKEALVIHSVLPIDPELFFSLSHPCVLSLSDEGVLSLTYLCEESKPRYEPLVSGVKEMGLSFFDAKEKCWTPCWEREKQTLPAIIKLTIASSLFDDTLYFFPSQNTQAIQMEKAL